MEEQTEHIERYLKDQLSESERADFENAMKRDSALADSVRMQRKATELLEAGAWLSTKEKVAQLNQQRNSNRTQSFLLRAAAVFIGVCLLAALYQNYRLSDEQLYAKYAEPYPDRISVMGSNSSDMEELMNLYNQEKYEEAAREFSEYRANKEVSDLLVLYEAISLQKIGEGEIAIELLQQHELENQSLEEVFAWQLILAHLSIGESEQALQLLHYYEESEYQYQSDYAQQLTKELQSFWRF